MGSAGLNERVFDADVIARVRLMETQATAERLGVNDDGVEVYRGVLEFAFEVLEYLKSAGRRGARGGRRRGDQVQR